MDAYSVSARDFLRLAAIASESPTADPDEILSIVRAAAAPAVAEPAEQDEPSEAAPFAPVKPE